MHPDDSDTDSDPDFDSEKLEDPESLPFGRGRSDNSEMRYSPLPLFKFLVGKVTFA